MYKSFHEASASKSTAARAQREEEGSISLGTLKTFVDNRSSSKPLQGGNENRNGDGTAEYVESDYDKYRAGLSVHKNTEEDDDDWLFEEQKEVSLGVQGVAECIEELSLYDMSDDNASVDSAEAMIDALPAHSITALTTTSTSKRTLMKKITAQYEVSKHSLPGFVSSD